MRSVLSILLLALAIAALSACGQANLNQYSPTATPTPDQGFKTAVRNTFAQYDCAAGACHSATYMAGGLSLDASLTCQQAYDDVMVYVVTTNATSSLILTKPTNTSVPQHGGNKIFEVDSPPYDTILHWIEAGAPDDCGG